MKELIVTQSNMRTPIEIALGIDEQGMTTARKLYGFLELAQGQFARWAKTNITENQFAEENIDFVRVDIDVETPTGGKIQREDYRLSATFAKKLSMQGKTERAEQARNYFIKVEDKLKEVVARPVVKQLTITSRDICRIMGKPLNQHGVVLRDIRDCIAELEGMGFNRLDFFQDSTYIGGNKEVQPQFLVTERGCEFYSGRLESEERRQFIKEYTDRFERLKLAAEGRPIKALETLAEGQGTVIRIYQNNKWGILSMNGELYNLTPDELKLISELVPKLDKNGVRQIPQIISTMLEGADRSGKLEKIGQYCLHDSGEISYNAGDTPALPGMVEQTQDKKQIVNLNEAINLTKEQARARYGIGFVNLRDLADKIGAINYCGNRILFVRQILDDYFNKGDQTYRPGR